MTPERWARVTELFDAASQLPTTARQAWLEATDADFSAKHFHEIYTADLVNTFANCASVVPVFGSRNAQRTSTSIGSR